MRKIWLYLLCTAILAAVLCGCSGKSESAGIGAKLDITGEAAPSALTATAAPFALKEDADITLSNHINESAGFSIGIADGWGGIQSKGDGVYVIEPADTSVTGTVTIHIMGELSGLSGKQKAQAVIAQREKDDGANAKNVTNETGALGGYYAQAFSYEMELTQGLRRTVGYAYENVAIYYDVYSAQPNAAACENALEAMIGSYAILLTPGEEEVPPEPTPEPDKATGKRDWLEFAGHAISPDEIAAMFGEPADAVTGENEAGEYLIYHYRNASFQFYIDTQGSYMIEAIINHRPDSPITIGGVSVGMATIDALSILAENGYEQNTDTWDGAVVLQMEKRDEEGNICLVELIIDETRVTEVAGYWGPAAI